MPTLAAWPTQEHIRLPDTEGFDLMGRPEEAVEQFASARLLFGRSIGADSVSNARGADMQSKCRLQGINPRPTVRQRM